MLVNVMFVPPPLILGMELGHTMSAEFWEMIQERRESGASGRR